MCRYRLEMGDKFTASLSDAGELLLMIQNFSPSDVGEYKVVAENEFGAASQIIRMDMAGTITTAAAALLSACRFYAVLSAYSWLS